MIGILISQLLCWSNTRADNAEACFEWQIFLITRFFFGGGGVICDYFFRFFAVLTLNLVLTSKRHRLIRKDICRCIS